MPYCRWIITETLASGASFNFFPTARTPHRLERLLLTPWFAPFLQKVLCDDFRLTLPELEVARLPEMELEVLEYLDWEVSSCSRLALDAYVAACDRMSTSNNLTILRVQLEYGHVLNRIARSRGVSAKHLNFVVV